jgi:hypothetical protein
VSDARNHWNACVVCGALVRHGTGLQAVRGWEDADGQLAEHEVMFVIHAECYMAAAPAERAALLDAQAQTQDDSARS